MSGWYAMSPDESKARARRLPEELLTQGDLGVAGEVLAADCLHHAPVPLMPGIAGVTGWVTLLRRAFPDLHAIVEDEIAEGDRVVQRLTLCGTHEGEFIGFPPTGKRVAWQLVAIQRLGEDGKIAEYWSSGDLFGLLEQLGVVPATACALPVAGVARERDRKRSDIKRRNCHE
jgi:predicted ester cyclase